MFALLTANPRAPELFMPTGDTVQVPTEVIEQAGPSHELEYALRWANKAGLINRPQLQEALDTLGVSQVEMGELCGA